MSKQNKQPLLQHPAVVGVLASLLSIVIGLVLGFVLIVVLLCQELYRRRSQERRNRGRRFF